MVSAAGVGKRERRSPAGVMSGVAHFLAKIRLGQFEHTVDIRITSIKCEYRFKCGRVVARSQRSILPYALPFDKPRDSD
eukprot:3900982-Pleurochrysis_carterae.AAC.1